MASLPSAAAQYVLLPNSLCGQGDHIETWWFEQLDCFSTRLVTSIFAPSEPKTECECDHWQREFDVRQQVAFEDAERSGTICAQGPSRAFTMDGSSRR